jgi:uncharacterized membrane protein
MVGAPSTVRVGRNRTFPFGTPAQGVHEVYDLGRFPILGGLDLFASVLFTQQFFQRLLVVILEFFRIETFFISNFRTRSFQSVLFSDGKTGKVSFR